MSTQIITANRLTDGVVVYFTADNTWSHWVADAHVCADEDEAQTMLSLAQDSVAHNEVLDAYLIEVVSEASTIKPVRYREIIRAKGPSISLKSPGKSRVPAGAIAANGSGSSDLAFLNGI